MLYVFDSPGNVVFSLLSAVSKDLNGKETASYISTFRFLQFTYMEYWCHSNILLKYKTKNTLWKATFFCLFSRLSNPL